uniref:glycosyltransferase family 2 protein n=1 Tax=Bifidobacterium adolescentis TaxID=1680 RepID=UPI00359C5FD7
MTDETKPSSSPLVSIIVPVWNAKQYLDNCINSLRSQTYPNLEIILVDDGSTDGSSELCDAAMETDWRIHVIHQSDRGVSAARNAGLDAATGEFVAFVDSDDSLRREAVAESVRCAVTHSSDMVVFGYDVIEEHADGSVTKQESKTVRQGDVIDTRRRHEKIVADQLCALDNDELLYQCWGKLYRRSNISGLRFTDDVAFGEDTVFVLELLSHGVRLTFLQRCLYVYRQHADSLIRGFRPGKAKDLEYVHGKHLAFYQDMPISEENRRNLYLRMTNDALWAIYDAGRAAGTVDKTELLCFVRHVASSPYRNVYLRELRHVAVNRSTKIAFAINMTSLWKWYLR